MSFDPEPILVGVLSTLSGCPLCGEVDALDIVKRGRRMACRACKARWAVFRRTPGGALAELVLDKTGSEKIGRELWGKQKSFDYWRALQSDPRPAANLAEVEQLLNDLDSAFRARLERSEPFDQAIAALAAISAVGRAELEAIAADSSHANALAALWYLAQAGDDRWVPILEGRLGGGDTAQRVVAVDHATFLTEETGDQALIGHVAALLVDDPSPAIRLRAAVQLRRAKPTPEVVSALWQALDDSEKPAKERALDAGDMADLAQGEWERTAAWAVGVFVDAVREGAAWKRPRPTVGEASWASLKAFGESIRSELTDRMGQVDSRTQAAAACLLAILGDASVMSQLIENLNELEPARRLEASIALAELGAEEGRAELKRLGGGQPDVPVWVRREARAYLEDD